MELLNSVCRYICIYVCMYIYMYVCMDICMFVCMHVCACNMGGSAMCPHFVVPHQLFCTFCFLHRSIRHHMFSHHFCSFFLYFFFLSSFLPFLPSTAFGAETSRVETLGLGLSSARLSGAEMHVVEKSQCGNSVEIWLNHMGNLFIYLFVLAIHFITMTIHS